MTEQLKERLEEADRLFSYVQRNHAMPSQLPHWMFAPSSSSSSSSSPLSPSSSDPFLSTFSSLFSQLHSLVREYALKTDAVAAVSQQWREEKQANREQSRSSLQQWQEQAAQQAQQPTLQQQLQQVAQLQRQLDERKALLERGLAMEQSAAAPDSGDNWEKKLLAKIVEEEWRRKLLKSAKHRSKHRSRSRRHRHSSSSSSSLSEEEVEEERRRRKEKNNNKKKVEKEEAEKNAKTKAAQRSEKTRSPRDGLDGQHPHLHVAIEENSEQIRQLRDDTRPSPTRASPVDARDRLIRTWESAPLKDRRAPATAFVPLHATAAYTSLTPSVQQMQSPPSASPPPRQRALRVSSPTSLSSPAAAPPPPLPRAASTQSAAESTPGGGVRTLVKASATKDTPSLKIQLSQAFHNDEKRSTAQTSGRSEWTRRTADSGQRAAPLSTRGRSVCRTSGVCWATSPRL